MIIWKQEKMAIYLTETTNIKSQIKIQIKIQIRGLLFDKVFIIILSEYFHYNNVFLKKNVTKLLKYIKINNNTIKFKKNEQSSFGFIYKLELIKLEILKTYIKINLTNGFI